MAGRKPDYRVAALRRSAKGSQTDYKNNNIGAAWINENGNISLKIEPFVVIEGGPDILITLFPNDKDQPDSKRADRFIEHGDGGTPDDSDYEKPF